MTKRIITVLILVAVMVASLVSCGDVIQPINSDQTNTTAHTVVPRPLSATDLTKGIVPDPVIGAKLTEEDIDALYDVYLKFFKSTVSDEKAPSLISPLSIITALGMVADGANGETLAQFETLFGITAEQLDKAISFYSNSLSSTDKAKFESANSIWFTDREDFKANEDYIARVLGAYFPSLYTVDFGKSSTVDEINGWVSDHTDEMIDKIVDELDPLTVMVLINAIVFDAKWESEYEDYQVGSEVFHAYDGTEQTIDMMHSMEDVYISMNNACGFAKYYSGNKYQFVALLPDEGIDIYDFVAGLDAGELKTALARKMHIGVEAGLPKFSYDYDITLNSALNSLGLNDAFDPDNADFTKMATIKGRNIYISKVIHKTHIDVDESGTKAAAVTGIIMDATAVAVEPKTVVLDRPFVYMIVDSEYNMPIFMGIVTEIDQ